MPIRGGCDAGMSASGVTIARMDAGIVLYAEIGARALRAAARPTVMAEATTAGHIVDIASIYWSAGAREGCCRGSRSWRFGCCHP